MTSCIVQTPYGSISQLTNLFITRSTIPCSSWLSASPAVKSETITTFYAKLNGLKLDDSLQRMMIGELDRYCVAVGRAITPAGAPYQDDQGVWHGDDVTIDASGNQTSSPAQRPGSFDWSKALPIAEKIIEAGTNTALEIYRQSSANDRANADRSLQNELLQLRNELNSTADPQRRAEISTRIGALTGFQSRVGGQPSSTEKWLPYAYAVAGSLIVGGLIWGLSGRKPRRGRS